MDGGLWAGFGQGVPPAGWIIGPQAARCKPCRPGPHSTAPVSVRRIQPLWRCSATPAARQIVASQTPRACLAFPDPLAADCLANPFMGSLWAFRLSSLARQETSVGLEKATNRLQLSSRADSLCSSSGHVHHFAPSPTNLWQTSHCAMYSRFACRLFSIDMCLS